MRFLVAVLLTITGLSAYAGQKTIINGTAPGAELRNLTITTPGDLITFIDRPLAKSKVDSAGHFSVTIDLDEITYIILSIDFHKAELFLEPGKTYNLQVGAMKYDEYTEINPFIQSQKLAVDLPGAEPGELNTVISLFNAEYSAFLMENFNALYRDHNKLILDTFRIRMNKEFGSNKNPYFIDYATYKVASLEQLTRYYSQALIAKKYFIDKPIRYGNLEYMDFFNSFFSKYMTVSSGFLHKIDFKPLMKGPTPYTSVMKAMAADTLLKNEQLRELLLLKGLMEFWNLPGYSKEDILSVLKGLSEKSKFAENISISANIINQLTRLTVGTAAPVFTLLDRTQKNLSLSDLKGKPVVLNFWTTYCEGCLAEMDLIKPLADKYKDQLQFVSISADKYFSKMLYFINLKPDYTWTFLNTGDQSDVLRAYDVRSYPLFVLIDREGRIFKYQAELPSKGLETELLKLLDR